jgi:hypothetical protein
MADLDDPRLAPVKTRKKPTGRKPLVETAILSRIKTSKQQMRLKLSEDIVLKLLRQRDGAGASFNRFTKRGLRLETLKFTDKQVPAVFVRIAAPSFDPIWPRLIQKGRAFHSHAQAKNWGIKATHWEPTKLKMLWLDNPKGLLLIIPDEFMLADGPKIDAELAFGRGKKKDPGTDAGV